jgi:FAD/FMN-containing dehydrogenase
MLQHDLDHDLGRDLDDLAALLRGRSVRRGDPDYDEVRSLYNAMIDKRPVAIAQCVDAADVVAAIRWARDHDVPASVRGGGHNGPGLASIDDGLMIDLSAMRGVRVDPAARTVRVEGGCTIGDVDHAAGAYGLAVPFGIMSTTGVAGLTLGGGTGHLTRKYGLSVDNLLEADVVLADGTTVTASPTEHADLLWALRGGGGNFGVVTSFLFRAHPVTDVYAGPVFWDFEHAATVMRAYRDFLPSAREELGLFVGLDAVPDAEPFPAEYRGKPACVLVACYDGPAERGAEVMAGLLDALPAPLLNGLATMPYPAVQTMFDPLLPKGLQWYWRGDFVSDLSDAAIDVHVEQARAKRGAGSLMHLYPIDGAVHRVGANDTAWNTRDATWSMVIAGIDDDPGQAAAITQWVKEYWAAVHPFSAPGGYVNFMMGDGDQARLRATYGDNYDRLAAIKRRYDPTNFFSQNQNILPEAAA